MRHDRLYVDPRPCVRGAPEIGGAVRDILTAPERSRLTDLDLMDLDPGEAPGIV